MEMAECTNVSLIDSGLGGGKCSISSSLTAGVDRFVLMILAKGLLDFRAVSLLVGLLMGLKRANGLTDPVFLLLDVDIDVLANGLMLQHCSGSSEALRFTEAWPKLFFAGVRLVSGVSCPFERLIDLSRDIHLDCLLKYQTK